MSKYRIQRYPSGQVVVYNLGKPIANAGFDQYQKTWASNELTLTLLGETVLKARPFSELLDDQDQTFANVADADTYLDDVFTDFLKPIEIFDDVTFAFMETISLPTNNPHQIGLVQQMVGNTLRVVDNVILTDNNRVATFSSLTTETNNKMIIWPRER